MKNTRSYKHSIEALAERTAKLQSDYGDETARFFIDSAPHGRILSDLKSSDSDLVWMTTALHLVNLSASSKDPTPLHFSIAREFLKSIEVTEDEALDLLSRELVCMCKNFQKFLHSNLSKAENDSILTSQDGSILLPPRDYLPDVICENNGYNSLDFLFSKYMKSCGKKGKSLSEKLLLKSKDQYIDFSNSGFTDKMRPQFWQLWISHSEDKTSVFSNYLCTLVQLAWENKVQKKWKNSSTPSSLIKAPINLFNVMLSSKDGTLGKISKRIVEFESKIPKTEDPKKKIQLQTQLKLAKEMHEKASKNFPEDFGFSVYEQYAIYGALKLLYDNNFNPVEFYFRDILSALQFPNINKKEITEIRKAFVRLTTQKFPCYMVYPDPEDKNTFCFYDGDEPIFKLWEFGTLDLNIDLSDSAIAKKKLFLSLSNAALLNDLSNFYSMIQSNIIAELRAYKRVSEDDLYFLASLMKEGRFHKSTTKTIHQMCAILKKAKWLENGIIVNRDNKRWVKEKIVTMLKFAQEQDIVSEYSINKDVVSITYKKQKNQTTKEVSEIEMVH